MLQPVDVGRRRTAGYEAPVGAAALEELGRLAAPLRDARVLHLNATPYGGGVAELLRSLVPLLCDLGLRAEWRIISGGPAFFEVTKRIHNALQGAALTLSASERETYLAQSAHNARLFDGDYDVVVVHDPQPAALLQLHGKGSAHWIWRCHIDTSEPNAAVWEFLRPFLTDYDAAVFTMPEFVPPAFPIARLAIVPPAIDPLSPKNLPLADALVHDLLSWIGIDPDYPLVTQVSRFDPWKDQPGVIAAYRIARQEVPRLQLALVGSMALDDPEGWEVYRQIREAAADDPLIHVFTNLTGVGNVEVNAFQRLSRVVIQKSIREGFGLTVSEALWKGTPVVAGRAGGIPLQMPEGTGGYLVASVEECAERLAGLLRAPEQARELGQRGREHVRQHFLLPRLLADELRLIAALAGAHPLAAQPWETTAAGQRCPECGMPVAAAPHTLTAVLRGVTYAFCSPDCRDGFLRGAARRP
ncbi:MAG: glycosyltransferase [Chloroflexi bacterium]|nr:glycosyltransferase [Chloroflexota bacterium]